MLSVLKKYSILYVEDEPEIQANIAEYLEDYFQIVYLASDGKEALELYQRYCPHALLLDINVPYIDGLSLAKEIRQKDKNVKMIMLTGVTDVERLVEATELKLTKYLVKPISPKKFKECMILLANELIETSSSFIHLSEDAIWNSECHTLTIKGENIFLVDKELKLLQLFIEKRGSNVSYEDIMVALWEDSFEREISIDSVKNQVSHLRKKLPKALISNVYGQGYRLL